MTVRTTQPHGTANSYGNLKCRCAECTEAWRVYDMNRRPCPRCGGPKSFARKLCRNCSPAFQQKHGISRYRKGCRCDVCVAVARADWIARQASKRSDPEYRAKENAKRQERRKKAVA